MEETLLNPSITRLHWYDMVRNHANSDVHQYDTGEWWEISRCMKEIDTILLQSFEVSATSDLKIKAIVCCYM